MSDEEKLAVLAERYERRKTQSKKWHDKTSAAKKKAKVEDKQANKEEKTGDKDENIPEKKPATAKDKSKAKGKSPLKDGAKKKKVGLTQAKNDYVKNYLANGGLPSTRANIKEALGSWLISEERTNLIISRAQGTL
jgi:hypothetical protein